MRAREWLHPQVSQKQPNASRAVWNGESLWPVKMGGKRSEIWGFHLLPPIFYWSLKSGRLLKNPRHFREEVATTLLHELGHYLGLDEDEVETLGLG